MNLLILGGVSAEREHIARTFHQESRLRRGPFVTVTCGNRGDRLTRSLLPDLQSRGSHHADDIFRESEGGTLFVDEIDLLPLATQRLLFDFLRRGRSSLSTDSGWSGRIAAGSATRLEYLARRGQFHSQLFDALDKLRIDLLLPA
jgi:DNA-binding NtrC family response regulator